MLTYVYRVTKYDPADRDGHGHYTGPEETVSDHGEVEAAYLRAVAAFAADTGIDHLDVREPQVPSLAHFGVEPPVDGFGLEGLFPSGQAGFHDGAQVLLDIALELVRVMLRDNGAWCRLEVEDTFAVHVGWDQYLYISSSRPCEEALARTRELGLFPERVDASPYASGPRGDFAEFLRGLCRCPGPCVIFRGVGQGAWTTGAVAVVLRTEECWLWGSRWRGGTTRARRLWTHWIPCSRLRSMPRPCPRWCASSATGSIVRRTQGLILARRSAGL